jgi:hypothetical protein
MSESKACANCKYVNLTSQQLPCSVCYKGSQWQKKIYKKLTKVVFSLCFAISAPLLAAIIMGALLGVTWAVTVKMANALL